MTGACYSYTCPHCIFTLERKSQLTTKKNEKKTGKTVPYNWGRESYMMMLTVGACYTCPQFIGHHLPKHLLSRMGSIPLLILCEDLENSLRKWIITGAYLMTGIDGKLPSMKIDCGQIQYLADKYLYNIDYTIYFPTILFWNWCKPKPISGGFGSFWTPFLLYCNHKQEANVGDSLSLSKAS